MIEKVETQFAHFAAGDDSPLLRERGGLFGQYTLAYETYGALTPAADNAVILFHALSGSQHAAGINKSIPGVESLWTSDCYRGWWNGFIGPGLALDTNKLFVICINFIGGCYGSTGPSSINPDTGRSWGGSFPRITVNDIVDSQVALLKRLGIRRLHAAIGPSLGGMLALNLSLRYPQMVENVISLASGWQLSVLQRILRLEQICAIETDPNFNRGDYYDGARPDRGLSLARMIAHKSYVSLSVLEARARDEASRGFPDEPWRYQPQHAVESYMIHHGEKFLTRFDANTYLRIAAAWQSFDIQRDSGEEQVEELFKRAKGQRYLVFSIDSDVCFYPDDQRSLVDLLKAADVSCQYITVHSDKGHDSFLLEPDLYSPHISFMLR